MKVEMKVPQRRSWQERVRMTGAVTLALFALAGLFVAVGPRPATAQSTGGNSAEQAPSLQVQAPIQAPLAPEQPQATDLVGQYKIIGWNDLGMHCMNESFANLAVLPPYNNLWAQVIRQGPTPEIVTSGVTVEYSIIDNTYSVGKTNFWQYAKQLFGADLAPNVGLTGATLAGQMHIVNDHFAIEGVPLTPYRDSAPQPGPQNWYPYQLAKLIAKDSITGQVLAETITVAPVSTEMRCDTCHADGMREGIRTGNVETNILTLHDKEENTNLMGSRPVLCATCHGSNALGAPGKPGIPNLSRAMHNRHAPGGAAAASPLMAATQALIDSAGLSDSANPSVSPSAVTEEGTNNCYLCHPGQQTQCLRDVMYAKGMTCINCHGGTADVAASNRRPWIDEPKCGTCHASQYAENTDKRYRDSVGHGGLYCEACHGSPHAILPSIEPNDNIQNIALQGHAGTLSDCTVCHATVPDGPGPHGIRPGVTPTATASPTATATGQAPTATPTATATDAATATPTRTQNREKVEFQGLVQARPAGRTGLWRIADRDVIVDGSTRFDESKGPAVVGAKVAVVGYKDSNGQILALQIKVENAVATPVPTTKMIGEIKSLPGGNLIGSWQVDDQTVAVTAATQILGDHARYRVGTKVRVRGLSTGAKSIAATVIELYNSN